MKKDILDILDSITWYNGIGESLIKLKEDLIKQNDNGNYLIIDHNLEYKNKEFADEQFEIFWMMLVLLYGNYGTSPRSGWLEIKNKDKIINFIDKITKTTQEEK